MKVWYLLKVAFLTSGLQMYPYLNDTKENVCVRMHVCVKCAGHMVRDGQWRQNSPKVLEVWGEMLTPERGYLWGGVVFLSKMLPNELREVPGDLATLTRTFHSNVLRSLCYMLSLCLAALYLASSHLSFSYQFQNLFTPEAIWTTAPPVPFDLCSHRTELTPCRALVGL